MFGDNNGDDDGNDDKNETYTAYVVYNLFDDEVEVVDTPEEAEVIKEGTTGGYIEEEERPLDEPLTEDDDQSELDPVLFTDDESDEPESPEDAWNDSDDLHDMPERDDSGVEVLDAEPVDDPNDGYAFWRQEDTAALTADGETRKWTLGDHEVRHDVDTDAIREAAADIDGVNPDLAAVLENAADSLSSASVSGFECPVCGLNHGHSDTKHDIRSPSSGFSVTGVFADFMEFCPYCHCGVNELAMLIDFYNHIDAPVFEDAEKFAGIENIRNSVLIAICKAIRESEEDHTRQTLTVDAAAREVGGFISPNLDSSIRAFYKRWKAIKDAADGAPIAGSTRTSINQIREGLNDQFGY